MKATSPLCKRITRLALNTKQANKGFYKGTGTGSTGRHTQHGGYIIECDDYLYLAIYLILFSRQFIDDKFTFLYLLGYASSVQ